MKICLVSGCISRSGGTERVGSILANELSKIGYEVNILSFWNQGKPHYKLNSKVRVFYLLNPKTEGKLYRTYLYPILKYHNFILKQKIDIVVDIDTELAIYTAYARKHTTCKWISWEHFNYWTMLELNERKRFIAKKLIKKYCDNLVTLTEDDRKEHIKRYNLGEEFVTTINNPCISNVRPNYTYDSHIFISVGRLTYLKGYDLLLNAWNIVEKEVSDWKLMIVGSGELEEELINLLEQLNLKNVMFIGHKENIIDYYSKSSCYVMSSRFEGFPMVLLEAQSFGLPVISFDCKTGPRDLVHEDNGILVENGNINDLAKAMIEFTKNRDAAIKMSKSTEKSVKKYNLAAFTKSWNNLLQKIYRVE